VFSTPRHREVHRSISSGALQQPAGANGVREGLVSKEPAPSAAGKGGAFLRRQVPTSAGVTRDKHFVPG